MYLNKALVYGNLTRDPELKSLPSGAKVTSFSIATNRVWKNKDGVKQESPEFHNIVVFGRQAETVAQYLKKGSSALVEGRMQTRSWESDGVKKYRTEIVADRVQFGPKGAGASVPSASVSTGGADVPQNHDNQAPDIEYPEEDIKPEDIPF
jgi:single-strand DNA-binding protein